MGPVGGGETGHVKFSTIKIKDKNSQGGTFTKQERIGDQGLMWGTVIS